MSKQKSKSKEILKVELEFIEPLLGTLPGDEKLAEEYVQSKHPEGVQKDEQDSLSDEMKKFSSYFARDSKGKPILWDYQIKGFFKDACSMMRRVAQVDELKAHKKIIDGLIFVTPRQIELKLSDELLSCILRKGPCGSRRRRANAPLWPARRQRLPARRFKSKYFC